MINVLFLCSANLERSPTAEALFSDFPGWNVKSAGTKSHATTLVSEDLLKWADKIFVMENAHLKDIQKISTEVISKTKVLGIRDNYNKNSSILVVLLLWKMIAFEQLDNWLIAKLNLYNSGP